MLPRRLLTVLAALGAMLVAAGTAVAAKPAPPAAPDLDASSDSGTSATDNVTNDSTPDFTVDAGPGYAGFTVKLYFRNRSDETNTPVQVGSATVSSAGLAKISVLPAMPQGSYDVTATVTNTAAEESDKSAIAVVSLDLEAPLIETAPVLYDVVISNQAALTTFTSLPRFLALVESGASVTLWEGSTSIGSGVAAYQAGDVGGVAYAFVRVTMPLVDGLHSVYATVTDIAGNVGTAPSPTTTFIVDTIAAPVGKPKLAQDALATGADSTKSPRPTFEVESEAGARVTVYENGIALGAAVADAGGVASVRINEIRWLDPGEHCVYAIAMDENGNDSKDGPTLCITVEEGVPPFTSNLGLDLSEDYLMLSLTSTLAAKATIRIKRGAATLRVLTRSLAPRATRTIRVRIAGKGSLRVVAKLRSKDGRALVIRRTARR